MTRYIRSPPPEAAGFLLALLRSVPDAQERHVPEWFADLIRDIVVIEPTSVFGSESSAPETIGVGVTEKAIELGCSPEWVRHLCRTGRLPARRIGRRDWLIATQEPHDDDDRGSAADVR